jgi:hypothetical protein
MALHINVAPTNEELALVADAAMNEEHLAHQKEYDDYASRCAEIVNYLVPMLEVPDYSCLTSEVGHLLFAMRVIGKDKEKLPIGNEHGLKVKNLRKKAYELR